VRTQVYWVVIRGGYSLLMYETRLRHGQQDEVQKARLTCWLISQGRVSG
jgi:hypothetical protein